MKVALHFDMTNESFRTLLVDLPFASVHRPSVALSSLKACLTQSGFMCEIRYAKLDFASEIGTDLYRMLSEQLPQEALIGDFLFSGCLQDDTDHKYACSCFRRIVERQLGRTGLISGALWDALPSVRERATDFLRRVSTEILTEGVDLVGLNLTFQIAPGVSLAKLLKQNGRKSPLVIVGGGNCEGRVGYALQRAFPWIDFVCRGEGEKLIVDLVSVLAGGKPAQMRSVNKELFPLVGRSGPADSLHTIDGLIWWDGATQFENGHRTANIEDLDSIPMPDYADWFAQLDACGLALQRRELSMPFETSRGCWFGVKSHCTFCGLSGPSLRYRSKSPERVLSELRWISQWGVPNADAVDLILDMKYFDTLLPLLARENIGLEIFYEVKSNLTREHIRKLRLAGISSVQPGIESLSSPVLRLMRKGVSGLQNVRLLKWLAEFAIDAQWNILFGFPDEDPQEYRQMARFLPLISHLQPPNGGCLRVSLNRFSPLFDQAAELGVRSIQPALGYAFIFGERCSETEHLAYYFNFETKDGPLNFEYVDELEQAVTNWRSEFGSAVFVMIEEGPILHLFDSRRIARQPHSTLEGEARLVYLSCDSGASVQGLCRELALTKKAVEETLAEFLEQGWIVKIDDRYLSLAVSMSEVIAASTPTSLREAVCVAVYRKRMSGFRVDSAQSTSFEEAAHRNEEKTSLSN